ncbi:MAG: low temperature requirement protein A [Pseudonocardiaceae bacterium]
MRRVRVEVVGERASVTPLELFFDLVFVFALTQVTALMAQESAVTVTAVARGTLILAVLWWCWVCYAWLFNVIRADEGVARAAMFGAMGSMFVAAITIPEAFDDLPGGLPGPTVFAACYFVVRAIHILMFWLASRDDPTLRGQVIRFVPPMLAGTLLLLIAAQTTGTTQTLLWLAALAGDYLGTLVAGTNWRLNSAAHFAERHGLIIIVALGESIVSLGIGVAHLPVSWTIIVASGLGLAVTGALWWAYFDITSRITERALTAAQGPRQIMLARNGYSYLHLPMIIGIIMLALGLKKVLSYVAGDGGHTLPDPISGVPLAALYGGAALYLLAHVGFKVCLTGSVSRVRLTVVVLLVTLTPLIAGLPALATLAVLATVLVALIAYETMRYAVQRHEIRHDTAHGHARNDD